MSPQDFRQNELYVSTWIPVVIEHTCRATGERDLFADLLLSELLSNNERLLDEVITADTVAQFEALVLSQVGLLLPCVDVCVCVCVCVCVYVPEVLVCVCVPPSNPPPRRRR